MLLDKIRNAVIENKGLKEEDLIIRGLWAVDCLFKPNLNERTFNYKFIVAQTVGQGCAYSMVKDYDIHYLESLMGKNYLDLKIEDTALEIAVLDSIYASLQGQPDQVVELSGYSTDKATPRAKTVVGEALRLLNENCVKNEKPLVCNVGVVGNMIKQLLDNGVDVIGSDFDDAIVGKKMFDKAQIVHGDNTLEVIEKSDVAIVTGMTLATGTLDDILETAKKHNTKLVIFAETGSNFGDFYVQNGIDCAIGEPFPFYIYQGKNVLNIYRQK